MPLEKSKNQISNIQTVSGNFKKKIAANWERVSRKITELNPLPVRSTQPGVIKPDFEKKTNF